MVSLTQVFPWWILILVVPHTKLLVDMSTPKFLMVWNPEHGFKLIKNRSVNQLIWNLKRGNSLLTIPKQLAPEYFTDMSFQLFYLVLFTQGETTYRLCLAFESQPQADSDRCETFTTLESDRKGNGGITDYSLYGIIVAAVISLLFICVIGKYGYYKKICFILHFLLIDVD